MLNLPEKDWMSVLAKPRGMPFYTFTFDLGVTDTSIVSSDRDCVSSADSQWLDSEVQVATVLVKMFRNINEVSSIFLKFEDDGFLVWTLLKSYDRSARERVYEKELEVCTSLRIYDFDFRVTSKDLMYSDDLSGAGYHKIFSRL